MILQPSSIPQGYTPWTGKGQPPTRHRVHVIFRSGSMTEGAQGPKNPSGLSWNHRQNHADIIAFKEVLSDPLKNIVDLDAKPQ